MKDNDEKGAVPLGNAKDGNEPIYSNNDDYEWDIKLQRWRRVKGHNGAKALGKAELKKRKKKIANKQRVEWVSQNSFYYFLRKIFLKKGINPEAEGLTFRKSLTNDIAGWCRELKTTREDLMIYASSRAYLYHRGIRTAVSLESIKALALDGTDIIIIEKEDIAEVLHPYTDAAGIAILDTKGFVVQYARRLSRLAKKDNCNIAMLTDLDADGIFMTLKVKHEIPSLFRIGINFKTLEHFGIDAEAAGESYSGGTMKVLDKMHVPKDIATAEELEFIRNRRVEIDSVTTEVDDNKKFAEYIIETLVKKFKKRDYTRAIFVKDYAFPSILWDLQRVLKKMSKPILKDKVEEIEADLQEHEGIIENVETKEDEIAGELTNKLDDIARDKRRDADLDRFLGRYRFIQLVDGIQNLVDRFDTDEDESEDE